MASEIKETQTIPPSEAVLAVIASFLLLLFLGAIFVMLVGVGFAMVLGELLIAVVPFGYMLSKKINVRKYIGFEMSLKSIIIGIAIGALLLLFDIFVSNVLIAIFGQSETVEESNKLIIEMSSSLDGLILIVTSLALAGICEEFTFRGFLQNAISSKYSSGIALLASSLAFGFSHFDPQAVYMISAFLLGLVLGYVYYRWHSYTISATAHATLNLIVLALTILLP
jgi:membrane protease YdiL (CAAX protease family)